MTGITSHPGNDTPHKCKRSWKNPSSSVYSGDLRDIKLETQLQFTLLINFDVKTNEIRQVIKAGLIVIPFLQHLPPVTWPFFDLAAKLCVLPFRQLLTF
ncbi:hypothetical protein A6R68_07141 [Neotoma lepida]|uniref:Uncharacterized protein n=1 Tax=Neotoma lepida TaxID=56216 RepID=A0A1A6GGA9_NEOLE|nr:hypothetical protein A6R68_07141 [Neotoma lepida]